MSASFLGRKVFGGAASSAASSGSGASSSGFAGCVNSFASQYYAKYIQTNSIKPVLHVMAIYITSHFTITYVHKHKYETNNRFH